MKANNSEQVYEILKEEMMFLELAPGSVISEIEMASRFGVSRTPIRDVFKRLENEGMLQIIPQKGTMVSLIDLKNLTDMMYMREKLELSVVEDIIDGTHNEELVKLRLLLLVQEEIFNNEVSDEVRSKQFIKADNQFHRLIFKSVGKESIWDMIAHTTPHYQRFRAITNLQDMDVVRGLFKEHQNILMMLENRDKAGIRELYNKHIYGGTKRIAEIVKNNQELFSIN